MSRFFLNLLTRLSLLFLVVGLFFSHLEAYAYFRQKHSYKRYVEYELLDLGVSDVPLNLLSRRAFPTSQAPQIMDNGQVIYNDIQGGYLWDSTCGTCRLKGMNTYAKFHAINDKGTILASLLGPNKQIYWLLWPEYLGRRQDPIFIPAEQCQKGDIFFRSINNIGTVVGTLIDKNKKLFALAWPECREPKILCSGGVWGVTDNSYVVASDSTSQDNTPFIWHPRGGGQTLSDAVPIHESKEGNPYYSDFILSYDGSVYGSYTYEKHPHQINTFCWCPHNESFETIGQFGMRLSAMNVHKTMVGSVGNSAVVYKEGSIAPLDLSSAIEIYYPAWNLIEATDINEKGQIVGYAQVGGETHIFLLNPKEPQVITYR